MNKFLLINPFGIGDVLFTTPIVHTLKQIYPNCKIGYLCNKRSSAILKNNPNIDSIFIYDRDEFEGLRKNSFLSWVKKSLGFLNSIRNGHFDTALDFSLNTQYGFFAWVLGIKVRVGYDYKGRGRFLTKKITLNGYNSQHMVEYYARLLNLIGLNLESNRLELFPEEKDIINIETRLEANGINSQDLLVGIIPGGGRSWGKDAYLKHWDALNFARLADKIIANYKAKIIIMGDFLEKEISHKLARSMNYKVLDFTGAATIGEFIALLSKLDLVIANDGGPLHMAKALRVKTVSIFGPVDDKVYGPYPKEDSDVVIKKDLPCRPCYKNFRFMGCNYNRRCIKDINVDDIFEAIKSLLK